MGPNKDHELEELLNDKALFGDFVNEEFDVQQYTCHVIENHKVNEALAQLNIGINVLNKELLSQVSNHYEDLLAQATGIETLEGGLQSIQSKILSLVKSVERIKSQVSEPYNRIASRTRQLRRLQTTCDYLRQILRIIQLNKRLQSQLAAGAREITKAAQSLNELDYVLEGNDLSGIELITEDIKQIKEARLSVENQALNMFEQGLNTQNQPMIATSLQVFYNLGSLSTQVNKVLKQLANETENCINRAVDIPVSAVQNRSNLGGSTLAVTAFWEKFENLLKKLHEFCQKVYLLEKVLSKKRDPISHTCFIEVFSEEGNSTVFNHFWNEVCSLLRSNLDHAVQGSKYLQNLFEGEYPKLLRLFNDFWLNVTSFIDNNKATGNIGFRSEINIGFFSSTSPLESLKSCLQPFEKTYLSRSLSRLFDPINLVFPSGSTSVPTKDDLTVIIKTINSELSIAAVDEVFMIEVAKNVDETIQLYVSKCSELLVTTTDAGQLSGGLTSSQLRNVSIVNSLHLLHSGISELLPSMSHSPQEVLSIIDRSLKKILSFMDLAVSLLLSSVMASLENKIAKMHSENFSITKKAYNEMVEIAPCSRYVIDIQEFITSLQSDYLSLYNCQEFLIERLEAIAARVLELFVRHTCLLRNLWEGGKLKLAADMGQLEFALSPFCHRIGDLGSSYKLFRVFRPFLFQNIEDIPTNPNLGDSLPYSTAIHFLFSQAPPQLLSPHTVAGWSITEYSEWLDDHHEESERIALISGTLEAYAQKVHNQGDSELHQVYVVMKKLLSNQENTNTTKAIASTLDA
uniref:Conserved oligomeric Golgi complex subunit 5 n=1 Tax=Hydra vulgaris TaxID=6087 RepID=T2M2V9_HYDVU